MYLERINNAIDELAEIVRNAELAGYLVIHEQRDIDMCTDAADPQTCAMSTFKVFRRVL